MSFFSASGSQVTMSYVASGFPATLSLVAGYHTSTGAPSVDRVSVVSPTPSGPGLVKLSEPSCATVGTVSPLMISVPGTGPACGDGDDEQPANTVAANARDTTGVAQAPRRAPRLSLGP